MSTATPVSTMRLASTRRIRTGFLSLSPGWVWAA
jgi:hypothetical protein